MKEDKFEEMFQLEEEKTSQNITKKINQKIYRKALLVVLAVFLLIFGGIGGTHMILRNIYYDPYQEDASLFEGNDHATMQKFLMNTFISMNYPNMFVDGFWDINTKGFGHYETKGAIKSMFSQRSIGDHLEMITLDQSSYSISPVRNGSQFINKNLDTFLMNNYRETIKNNYLEEISLMPDSSIFEVYVTYENPIQLDEWNENMKVHYTYLLSDIHGSDYLGIPLETIYYYDNEKMDEKYPEYNLNSHTAEALYAHYQSYLRVLLDHEEFLKTMPGNAYENYWIEYYRDRLKEAEGHEVEIKGYSAYVKKNELIDIIHDHNSAYVYIQDVAYSSFER